MNEGQGTAARLRGVVHHIDLTVRDVALRTARLDRPHDRYTAGLHHLAFHAADRAYTLMREKGATILDPPAAYPQYGAGYYALFVADPDGLKLEVVHFIG